MNLKICCYLVFKSKGAGRTVIVEYIREIPEVLQNKSLEDYAVVRFGIFGGNLMTILMVVLL